jgi:hypothetical protein
MTNSEAMSKVKLLDQHANIKSRLASALRQKATMRSLDADCQTIYSMERLSSNQGAQNFGQLARQWSVTSERRHKKPKEQASLHHLEQNAKLTRE